MIVEHQVVMNRMTSSNDLDDFRCDVYERLQSDGDVDSFSVSASSSLGE